MKVLEKIFGASIVLITFALLCIMAIFMKLIFVLLE